MKDFDDEDKIHWATSVNTSYSLNWCYGQTYEIWTQKISNIVIQEKNDSKLVT